MDWEELNPDLLHLIVKKLGDVSNMIRFRAVCKKWRSVAIPSNPSPQLPWFLCPNRSTREPNFYSLYSNKVQNISIPEAHQKFIIGPSKRYILVADVDVYKGVYSSLFLLNPLTKTQVPHPLKKVLYYVPVYVGPPPTSSGVSNDVLTVLSLSKDCSLAFAIWQSNDEIWTRIELPLGINAIRYYKGQLFASGYDFEETFIIDSSTGCILEKIPNPKQNMYFNYLIEAAGDLLGVIKRFYDQEQWLVDFEVYRLEHSGNSSRWSKVSGIGDLMMFLDNDRNGFCVSASDFDGFKGNCIYFVKTYRRNGVSVDIYRYDMEVGKEEVIVSLPDESSGTWFVPSLF